jgi:hypothetical protein
MVWQTLFPDDQVNKSLTRLDIRDNTVYHCDFVLDIRNLVFALVSRCTNLDRVDIIFFLDLRRRLDLLLERKRLCNVAQAFAGLSFSLLFGFVKETAHHHEHGLSAIFVILQNDGDDHFYTAHNEKFNSQHQHALLAAGSSGATASRKSRTFHAP